MDMALFSVNLADLVFFCVFLIQILLAVLGFIFFVSGCDDLFIDICFVVWRLYRGIRPGGGRPSPSEQDLLRQPEKPIAVIIPAWDESDVIRPMLTNMLRTTDYGTVHIFVGTYPNDLETRGQVDLITAEFANVHQIVCGNPGPTCKADCLNWVYHGVARHERQHGIRFEIFVMDDCEDLVHPFALRLFNYMIPDFDMVQIPVFPLRRKWNDFVGGHYVDEFTEYHGKDIFVRRLLSGALPAAGVGCAFSRRALAAIAGDRDGELFNTGSLTEDYEFGLEVGRRGMRSTFVSHRLPPLSAYNGPWKPRDRADARIAVREYFPSTVRTAVKQKARWVIGIAFQGWSNLGWSGNLGMKYMLLRDRKTVITNQVCLFGYLIVLLILAFFTYSRLSPDAYNYPALVQRGSWLWTLLLFNVGFLLNRIWWRFYSVYRIYGWGQAFLAVPRQVCSNIVNGLATTRALFIFVRAAVLGRRIAWDKTAHVLPASVAAAEPLAAGMGSDSQ